MTEGGKNWKQKNVTLFVVILGKGKKNETLWFDEGDGTAVKEDRLLSIARIRCITGDSPCVEEWISSKKNGCKYSGPAKWI